MDNRFDAIIFDLDGTLIDSMWVWPEIDQAFLKKYNLTVPDDLEEELEGMSFTESAVYFKNRFHIEDSVEVIKKTWNEMAWNFYTNHIQLKEGAAQFLDLVRKRHLKLGIATSNSIELVTAILERFGITDFFHSIRTSCEVEKGKPHPYIFLKVAEDLEVAPDRCLVFEDIPNGVIAAKAAGMEVWAIEDRQDEKIRKELKRLADRFIQDYQEAIQRFINSKE